MPMGQEFVGPACPQSRDRFGDWIESLEPVEKRIDFLRWVEELPYHEIAATLAIPMGTVKWRIHAIRNKLSLRGNHAEA